MIHRSQSNSNSYKWNGLASSLGFFTFVLTFLSGCGTSDDAPALSLVSGTVMVEGEPVTEGQVTLIPNTQMGTRGPSFTGLIREDGSFSIYGPNGVEGAIPGEYQVVIYAIPATHEELMKARQNGRLKRSDFLHDSNIPLEYQSQQSTPLKIVVEAEQKNKYTFDLENQKGIKISRSLQ